MRYTDIVKARALRRAGRACEMCGTPVSFESARFVSAHPIFGILFDQDDCCVLCDECLSELDPDTRAAAQAGPRSALLPHEACPDPPTLLPDLDAAEDLEDLNQDGRMHEPRDPPSPQALPRGARETWFPKQDPDGGMCA